MLWEYRVERLAGAAVTPATINLWLNERGRGGWELIFIQPGGMYTFKKPIMEKIND